MFRTTTLALLIATLIGGIGIGYKATKNYYTGEIAKEKLIYSEAINKEKTRGEAIVATYVERLRTETERTRNYEKQAESLDTNKSKGSGSCYVSFGFIRLFNASATGADTSPASTDDLSSSVELTTVLTTILVNHGKYREVASQIEANKVYFLNH